MSPLRRIALLMGQDLAFSRDVIRGIRAYALRRPNWAFRNGPPDAEIVPSLRQWKPDGIIADIVHADFARRLSRLRRPIVDTAFWIVHPRIPVVDVDNLAVGRMAAEYLLSLGFCHFAFFGNVAAYSGLREKAFVQRLTESGVRAAVFHGEPLRQMSSPTNWKKMDAQTRRWLHRLPKPVAMFVCNDATARILADLCGQLGLHVPDEVALLGVDDDQLECLLTSPPLSSIAIPGERIGYEAAKLLDRAMTAPSVGPCAAYSCRRCTSWPANQPTRWPPTIRSSSPRCAYIQVHAAEGINVAGIVHGIGVGRRELERKFRAILGRSVLQELRRTRITQAQKLLAGTDLPMPTVAKLSGFASAHRLTIVFHRLCGLPPTAYRRQSQIRDA